ncbi:MAG: gliding motility protein GldB [Aureispira sp.]|nr:gliding motility protein GldB [Aureispira sp.]
MIYKKIGLGLFVLFVTIGLYSCSGKKKYIPDVSEINANIDIVRIEQEFMAIDTSKINEGIKNLKEKYGEFANLYLTQIVGQGFNIPVEQSVRGFRGIEYVADLYDSVQLAYPDLKEVEQDLEKMLSFHQYYFEDDSIQIKKVYTFFSLYAFGVFSLDDYIAIGLDFFLGADHKPYMSVENLRFQYIRRTLTKEHLVAKAAYVLASRIVDDRCKREKERLLDYMLLEGKKFYLVDLFLPNTPDSIKFSFSAYQIAHLEESEQSLYEHLLNEQLFLSDDLGEFRKYITQGPFNPDVNLPGNSGTWLGMQMLKSYVKETKNGLKSGMAGKPERELDKSALESMLNEQNATKLKRFYKPPK